MTPTILFCADPLAPRQPDADYQAEAMAARRAGFAMALCDYERLVHDADGAGALRRLPPAIQPTPIVYRGWMLPTERYATLYDGLCARGYAPITTPEAYQICHELPASYPFIVDQTPATIWLPREGGLELDQIMAALQPFNGQPVILKDYVKSRKHEWFEACFIPAADDRAAVKRVVRRFLELQGHDLAGGLVFRAYVPFLQIGVHPQSGLPLLNEHRAVICDRTPLLVAPYWETDADAPAPSLAAFAQTIDQIPSRFFTCDVAQRQDGSWLIVELGDGQVAGLPPHADLVGFYAALFAQLNR